ncbi:hypothetical protein HYU94_00345 [Candidatus Daviesbacteria bacterium]|nr:hypothetical protein [Candidatus Daviesbacteria bacterium]
MSAEEEQQHKWNYRHLYGTSYNPRTVHQLRAIRELGQSGSPEALDYLKKLSSFQESVVGGRIQTYTDASSTYEKVYSDTVYSYPNAKRGLRKVLSYRITTAWSDEFLAGWSDHELTPVGEAEILFQKSIMVSQPAHAILRTAIRNLEESLSG